MKKTSVIALAILTFVAGVTFLLTGNPQEVTAATTGQVINMGNYAEPKDLDPHVVTGVYENHILVNLFEGLIRKHGKTREIVPGMAEKWTVSKDGKTYTFNLRKTNKWSNGEPLTAKDFVYSITHLLEPSTAAEYAYMGYYIVNGELYNQGKEKDATKLGIKAIDDYTLQVKLNSPTPYFLQILDHYTWYPIHKATVEKHAKRWTRPENIVTNGPFILKSWELNKKITAVKNPNYWDAAVVQITEANWFPTENLDTEEKMFRTGQLHVTYDVPKERLDFWKNDKTGVYHSDTMNGTYYYRINTKKAPLTDKRVRKALALAIDRGVLVKSVTKGNEEPALTMVPPGSLGGKYTAKSFLKADLSGLAEAKALLAEAGFKDPSKMPPVEILYNTQEGHKKLAEALQNMWKQNLGINVTIVNQEWKVYLDSMRTLNYSIARSGWVGDYDDPNTYLEMLQTGNGNNMTGYANPAYDKEIVAASKEANEKKRLAHFHKAEEILLADMPIIPIYVYKRNYLKSKNVQGWDANLEDIHPLKYVSISPKS